MAAAAASQPPKRPSRASAASRSRSRTTTSRLGSRFLELPVMRAACRIRVSESSGIGRGRKGSLYAENQIAESARRLADRTRLSLDAMFFGHSITHSHFIQHLGEGE